MTIYDINYALQTEILLPPDKRKPKFISFFKAFTIVLQIIRDRFHNDYADGFTGDKWDVLVAYSIGDKIRYIDRSVYECILPTLAGIVPTNSVYFVKTQEIYIGLRERLRYNSRKMVLEYILNKWFDVDVSPADQIYITNNNIYGTAFVMGESGETSSLLANDSIYSTTYLGNAYSFGDNAFTIYVPVLVFNALDPDPTNAENIIRAQADKYVIAGIIYNIVTY
ncbi:MAG: hypothetical protein V4538_16315 [Bacteroidota bacterium]